MNVRNLINVPLLILSIVLLIVGYVLLGTGPVDSNASWKYAPVVLVAVYVFLFPLSIILKK
jgi:hypothetical protein